MILLAAATVVIPVIVPRCGDDAAPGEIVVCGRREGTESFRLPPAFRNPRFDPGGTIDSVSRERNRLIDERGGGIASCSPSGPGGMYGCAFRDFKRHLEQYGK